MTCARSEIIIEGTEQDLQCSNRCVRGGYLCGEDPASGQPYGFRREWIEKRYQVVGENFFVDLCAYAILDTHTHCEIRTRPDLAKDASAEEIAIRWLTVFPKKDKDGEYIYPPDMDDVEKIVFKEGRVEELRKRLSSASWFMKAIDEYISRRANKEDGKKGHFWQGRFGCQLLLDNSALLASMIYTDLNPVRAKMAKTPEESDFTSGQKRIVARQATKKLDLAMQTFESPLSPEQMQLIEELEAKASSDSWLCSIGKTGGEDEHCILPAMNLDEYLEVLDRTGRIVRAGKRGVIPAEIRPILERLEIDTDHWVGTVCNFGRLFHRVAGNARHIDEFAERSPQSRIVGRNAGRDAFFDRGS